ncbi:unnamed protein product, partial [Discosporangium mesarthrocarpum]
SGSGSGLGLGVTAGTGRSSGERGEEAGTDQLRARGGGGMPGSSSTPSSSAGGGALFGLTPETVERQKRVWRQVAAVTSSSEALPRGEKVGEEDSGKPMPIDLEAGTPEPEGAGQV